MSRIVCVTESQFFNAIERLNQRSIGFEADFQSLTITLTGTY